MREYSKEQLDRLKKEIARAAIRVTLEHEATTHQPPMHCFGDAKTGFNLLLDPAPVGASDTWEQRLPSVDAGPTGPIPTWYKNGELQPEPVEDVYATRYGPWFGAVEEVFEGWDELPDPHPFSRLAGDVELGAKALYVHVPGATDGLPADSGLTDHLSSTIDTIQDRTANFAGATAQTFHENYAAHLLTVAGGQYQLTGALVAALEGESQVLEEARATVMRLAEDAVDAMRLVGEGGPGGTSRDPNTFLNIVGIVAGAAANLFSKFNLAGTLASGAIALFDEIFPAKGGRDGRELPLAGATANDVLDRLRSALIQINTEINDEEVAIHTAAERAVDLSYGSVGDTYFNLPAPVIVTETDAKLLAGDPPLMKKVGNVQMPDVARQFEKVLKDVDPDYVKSVKEQTSWMRPSFIGFTDVGPHRAVSALYERLEFLLHDTAGELVAAGRSFSLAADILTRADDDAQEKLNQHAAGAADIAAPDPSQPHEPDRRRGAFS